MRSADRHAYLDWLRLFVIIGVLLFHGARPFIPDEPWHIEDAAKSNMLLEFNFFISRSSEAPNLSRPGEQVGKDKLRE